jgi:hypothetical protein
MAKQANGAGATRTRKVGNSEVIAPPRLLPEGAIPARHVGWFKPFQPGQSGNPGCYGGAYAEARRICAEASAEAARKQVELMASDDERVAFMAAEAVLNRGAGRRRDHSDEDTHRRVDLSVLSHEERATLAGMLSRVLGITTSRPLRMHLSAARTEVDVATKPNGTAAPKPARSASVRPSPIPCAPSASRRANGSATA